MVGSCPVHCRMLSNGLGLYPQNVRSFPYSSLTTKKCLQTLPSVNGVGRLVHKGHCLRSTGLGPPFSALIQILQQNDQLSLVLLFKVTTNTTSLLASYKTIEYSSVTLHNICEGHLEKSLLFFPFLHSPNFYCMPLWGTPR